MLENNLIKQCVCGNNFHFVRENINSLNVLKCINCSVIHQELVNWNITDYLEFYQNQYHDSYQDKKGVISYHKRYEHDCKIADIRLSAYGDLLNANMSGLDIGSSNSAFVHRARKKGISCLGLEPGNDIGDNEVTIRGTIATTTLVPESFDFVTMHDSIEHIVDLNSEMKQVNKILKKDGLLIIDLPDYFSEHGRHHWKLIEHLWIFTKDNLKELLNLWGFTVFKIEVPILGKFVFYARKNENI
jgi:SAM-dependent methyltransferase